MYVHNIYILNMVIINVYNKVNRLPLLLAQALGDSFPEDAAQTVLTLSAGAAPAEARVPTKVTLFD